MVSSQAQSIYRNVATQAQVHPVKLVHMMYERILLHFEDAIAAIEKKNVQQRGENLGKAIALVVELNASVQEEKQSEAGQFLRGMYSSILVELPKAIANNDSAIVRQAHVYITRLKEIWEQTAMRENGIEVPVSGESSAHAANFRPVEKKQPASGSGSLSVSI